MKSNEHFCMVTINHINMRVFILFIFFCGLCPVEMQRFSKHSQRDFLVQWRDSKKTIYTGDSVDELLALCPSGCGPGCTSFPVFGPKGSSSPPPEPCTADDIEKLRKAQELVQGWKNAIKVAPNEIIVHSSLMFIMLLLILFLIIRGHYRVRDLWFLSSDRQWELEKDPTWGLPGKVWGLLQIRVVKSEDQDSTPTDRKYSSYTENPTTLGDKFWYYKQALRDMYKTHKYYKRNRYFHKLAWQFTKLGKLIPETLRRHKSSQRRAGELEEQRSNASSADIDPQDNLPWEVDLADEVNMNYLEKAKVILHEQVKKEAAAGHMINGRYQHAHQHHHHHHHLQQLLPLTKNEIEATVKQFEVDPNADCVNVDGIMKRHPAAPKGDKGHRHHRHHHHSQQPKGTGGKMSKHH